MREQAEDKSRVPLKTILQNFLNHVDSMESQKRERENNPFEQEFQSLKAFSDALKQQPEYSSKEGEKDVNRKKNRYKDILPFDYTRVSLSDYPGVPGSDYINANYIKGASGSNAYIASQGPLPNTVNDFWRMVVECEVQVIVMACNEQEAGKYKCENYWNEVESEEKQFGKFFVKLLKSREICPDFLVRTMRLRWTAEGDKGEEERTVCQFHYSAWPDHGVPTQVKPLLEMVRLIRDCQASETLPVLVHCSAGCGRTGTICAIDFIWGLLRTGKLTADFSLYELVREMRRQRIAMVQTVEQYVLVHRAVRELFQEQLRVIDSHPYENVDGDGRPLCHNEDEITPDYETIFVKQSDDVKNAGDIDVILSQRMSQKNVADGGSTPPPQPPPKQRTPVETGAIDSRKFLEVPDDGESSGGDRLPKNRSSDSLCLFDPPLTTSTSNGDVSGTQKIKKGDLKLTQMENGSWRLEDSDKQPTSSTPATTTSTTATSTSTKFGGRKKKSKDSSSNDNSEDSQQQLLRRPSIKKIRALFQKDSNKESSSSNSNKTEIEGEESKEVLAAISKLPKFEPTYGNIIARSESASMPNSLDRRISHQSSVTSSTTTTTATSSKVLSSSENKPNLPVKRSKSMKVISKPVSFLFSSNPSVQPSSSIPLNNNKHFVKSNSVVESYESLSRSDTFPKNSSVTRFDFENLEVGNLPRRESTEKDLCRVSEPSVAPPKPVRSNSEYANVYVASTTAAGSDFVSADSVRHRISNYVNTGKMSKPDSSNSLNDDAKKMLKDCQDYLVASFETAEKEGERLLRSCANVAQVAKNRSAESSPMTTLQKSNSGRQLFSSHSSPSNSYNKYSNVVAGKSNVAILKSVSSPTGTIQKNFCSPAAKPVIEEVSAEVSDAVDGLKHNYENVSVTDGQVALAAQRKISAASVASSSRERRNSFREAVQGQGGASRKQSYESIWFAGDSDENSSVVYANASAVIAARTPGSSQPAKEPGPADSSIIRSNRNSMQLPKEATQTERERLGMDDSGEMADYESIVVSPEGRMVPLSMSAKKSREGHSLQSVALVNEVLYNQQLQQRDNEASPNVKPVLRKQYSNSSINSSGSAGGGNKGPPPPYKQPPPPPGSNALNVSPNISNSKRSISENSNHSGNTYANVQMRHPNNQNFSSSSKDDSVLSRPSHRRTSKTRSASQIVNNRLSCGDYMLANSTVSFHQSMSGPTMNGLTVRSNDVTKSTASQTTTTTSNSNSLPGIDLDAVAAMMQGGSSRASSNSPISSNGGGGPPPPRAIGRAIAGVLSGAAANLRSRFNILGQQQMTSSGENSSSLPATLPSMMSAPSPVQTPAPVAYHGEQLTSMLPITVPGATADAFNVNQSFPSNYPQRLDHRPLGPREPPPHFLRKQEYL